MKYNIYADNAATTRVDENALNRLIESSREYFNPSSLYSEAKKLKKE